MVASLHVVVRYINCMRLCSTQVSSQMKTDMLKWWCFMSTSIHYPLPIWLVILRLLNLCGCHQVSRDAMFQEASKARNAQELMVELQTMEKNRPEEFLEHLANFSEECLIGWYPNGEWATGFVSATATSYNSKFDSEFSKMRQNPASDLESPCKVKLNTSLSTEHSNLTSVNFIYLPVLYVWHSQREPDHDDDRLFFHRQTHHPKLLYRDPIRKFRVLMLST